MTKTEMLASPVFHQIRRRIFVRWMIAYESKATLMAMEEAVRLQACATEMDYLRYQRTGSRFPLTRKDKQSIWTLWDNAGNHALCEM